MVQSSKRAHENFFLEATIIALQKIIKTCVNLPESVQFLSDYFSNFSLYKILQELIFSYEIFQKIIIASKI
jgi:hypothetical protein